MIFFVIVTSECYFLLQKTRCKFRFLFSEQIIFETVFDLQEKVLLHSTQRFFSFLFNETHLEKIFENKN